jgi:type III pantothenate kinase
MECLVWLFILTYIFCRFLQISCYSAAIFINLPLFPLKNKPMSVNLCIDWGNTNVKAAIFDNDILKSQYAFSGEVALEKVSGLMDSYKAEKAILCSVTDHNDELIHLIKSRIRSMVMLDGYTRTPINNAYLSAATLGPDRLAMVCGAFAASPDKTNLVIGAGTCVTYNLLQKNKTFRGGAISPGLHMRLKAMNAFTDKLPEVELNGDLLLLGYDTETCMRSGAVYGMAAEIDGMISAYAAQYPDFNAILTGGDAPFLATKIKSKIFADPDVLLKGLNLILNYNVSTTR